MYNVQRIIIYVYMYVCGVIQYIKIQQLTFNNPILKDRTHVRDNNPLIWGNYITEYWKLSIMYEYIMPQ